MRKDALIQIRVQKNILERLKKITYERGSKIAPWCLGVIMEKVLEIEKSGNNFIHPESTTK